MSSTSRGVAARAQQLGDVRQITVERLWRVEPAGSDILNGRPVPSVAVAALASRNAWNRQDTVNNFSYAEIYNIKLTTLRPRLRQSFCTAVLSAECDLLLQV